MIKTPISRNWIVNAALLVGLLSGVLSCSKSTETEEEPEATWFLGDVVVVSGSLSGGGLTSMMSDSNSLYFNVYSGPLEKVSHSGSSITTVLPQHTSHYDRYDMCLANGYLFWHNGLMGGGDPGKIYKTLLSSGADIWVKEGFNDPKELQMVGDYLYFLNYQEHIIRVSLDGTSVDTLLTDTNRTITALAVSDNGDICCAYLDNDDSGRRVVAKLVLGLTQPVKLADRGNRMTIRMIVHDNVLYGVEGKDYSTGETPWVFSIDLETSDVHELVNLSAGNLDDLIVDGDGVFWEYGYPSHTIMAATHSGADVTTIGWGYLFHKHDSILYWANHDRVLRKRTIRRR